MVTPTQSDPADSKLRELGYDPAAPPETALEVLRGLLGNPQADQATVARALGEIRIPGAADLLSAMERSASGALRREIRRALFRLRQRGIVPHAAAPEKPSEPAPAAEPALSALLSPFDPSGARLVWIMKPRLQGGVTQLSCVVDEEEGLVGAGVATRSRREVRDKRGEIERDFGLKMVEADWRLADFIVCEAYRRTARKSEHRVTDFMAERAELIAEPPAEKFVHPIYAELLAAPAEPSSELLKEPAIAEWKFPAAALKPYTDEIARLQGSTLVLSPIQQKERVEEVMDKAMAGLFANDRVRRRLEDIAYYLARSGKTEPARWAAAAAAAIRDRAELKRIGFFRDFVRLVLGAKIAEEHERAKEEPRLIVTPAEAMREAQARARR
jgi:plasmid stabilization system protein ParE